MVFNMRSQLKPLETDKLKATLAEKKASGQQILDRANQLKYLAKHRKSEALLRQHKVIWEQQYGHLKFVDEKLQKEVYSHLVLFGQLSDNEGQLSSILADVLDLEDDRALFKDNVVKPLWHLREDLQAWIKHYKESLPLREHLKLHHHHIQDEVQSVWIRYTEMAYLLDQEFKEVEASVKSIDKENLPEELFRHIPKGVPVEFQELWCPDVKLKDNLVLDLQRLDDSYKGRLKDLDTASEKHPCPHGWTDEEATIFHLILEQYPSDLMDRRVLLFDRLKRTFPNKSLAQLMSYETWFQGHRFHKDRKGKCVDDWTRERWNWLLRCISTISQIQQNYENQQMTKQELQIQKAICHQLRLKVDEWRKDKEFERRQNAQLEHQRKMTLKVAQQSQSAKEERRRLIARQKLKSYYEARLHHQKETEDALQRRLEEMRQITKIRTVHDKERVQFRTHLFYQQLQDRHVRRMRLKEELQLRELKLEALRKKVRITAEKDPERITQATVASQARQDYTELDRPLFELYTFRGEEIMRDPRIRLENQLRDAGLLRSEYARQVLQSLKPLKHHRRDLIPSLEPPPE